MEEKERYYYDGLGEDIYDSEIDDYPSNETICNALNQQMNCIKELESKLRVSNSLDASLSLEHSELKKCYDSQEKLLSQKLAENSKLTLENQQLKQSQKQLAISELEQLKEKLMRYSGTILNKDGSIKGYSYVIKSEDFEKKVDTRIKELGGGDNDK